MGNRLTTKVLAQHKERPWMAKVRELIMAAPDINSDIFRETIVPAFEGIGTLRKTIYASSNDVALRASKVLHDFRRVGETIGGVMVFPGFDTIDVSQVAPVKREYGHSYVFDCPLVLADLADAVIGGREASKRKLKTMGATPSMYWILQ